MGWSPFEGREPISKLKFEERLTEMGDAQWTQKYSGIYTYV